jgi:hypothetical protein
MDRTIPQTFISAVHAFKVMILRFSSRMALAHLLQPTSPPLWPGSSREVSSQSRLAPRTDDRPTWGISMNGNRYYGVRVEGAKYGVGFGSALAIAISYTNNHSILWAIIHGILGWLYVIYAALFG